MPNTAAVAPENQATDADLIGRHGKLVRSLARRYSDGSNIDDLVQEGNLALLEARKGWREEAQFWTYARRFVLGAMVRYATGASSEPTGDGLESTADNIESGAVAVDDELELRELTAKLPALMLGLSDFERRVIRLHFVEDQSLAAVARTLDISNDKAERIYHAAIGKLRDRMAAQL